MPNSILNLCPLTAINGDGRRLASLQPPDKRIILEKNSGILLELTTQFLHSEIGFDPKQVVFSKIKKDGH